MKKILFLLACTLLVGCCAPRERRETITIDEGRKYIVEPCQFDYNGHTYLYFPGYKSSNIVHDPDCSCHKEEASIW